MPFLFPLCCWRLDSSHASTYKWFDSALTSLDNQQHPGEPLVSAGERHRTGGERLWPQARAERAPCTKIPFARPAMSFAKNQVPRASQRSMIITRTRTAWQQRQIRKRCDFDRPAPRRVPLWDVMRVTPEDLQSAQAGMPRRSTGSCSRTGAKSFRRSPG